MKHLNVYSTVCGDLPKLCSQGKPLVLVPFSEVVEFKNQIVKILTDKTHTQYQNECYINFLFTQIGMK